MPKFEVEILKVSKKEKLLPIYDLYKEIFVLKDGGETLNGFLADLSLNEDKKLIDKYGPFKELWISLSHNKKIIGAINFSAYLMPANVRNKTGISVTNHIIYILVDHAYRNHGIGKQLLNLAENYSKNFVRDSLHINLKNINLLSFCDFSNPELMTLKEYEQDSENSQIDPCDRAIFWCNHGFKQVEFNYILPPLNNRSKSCHLLTLNVRSNKSKISGELVLEHLRRFFEISVLKEKNLKNYSYIRERHELLSKNILLLRNNKKIFIHLKRQIIPLFAVTKKKDYNKKIAYLLSSKH